MAPLPARRPEPPTGALLHALVGREGTGELAAQRLVPLLPPLAEALGLPGLQRGQTVLLERSPFPGTSALALTLLAQPTVEGMWCALFGTHALGLAAAVELGVSLERLVLVPEVPGREAMFLATLLEGCDVVCAALSRPLSRLDARRLVARARERRGVLIVLGVPDLSRPGSRRLWPEEGDLTISVTGSRFLGLEEGGRINARWVELEARRRRGGAGRRGALWLPAREGGVLPAPAEGVPGDPPLRENRG